MGSCRHEGRPCSRKLDLSTSCLEWDSCYHGYLSFQVLSPSSLMHRNVSAGPRSSSSILLLYRDLSRRRRWGNASCPGEKQIMLQEQGSGSSGLLNHKKYLLLLIDYGRFFIRNIQSIIPVGNLGKFLVQNCV